MYMTEMLPLLNSKLTSDNLFILTDKPAVTKAVRQQTEFIFVLIFFKFWI